MFSSVTNGEKMFLFLLHVLVKMSFAISFFTAAFYELYCITRSCKN